MTQTRKRQERSQARRTKQVEEERPRRVRARQRQEGLEQLDSAIDDLVTETVGGRQTHDVLTNDELNNERIVTENVQYGGE